MHYLQRNREPIGNSSKTLKTIDCILKTENRKLKTEIPMITSTNEFHQVMPFSLFHCASNVPQTKRRQALRVILTHCSKIEMAYQVMKDIARNYPPIRQCPNAPFPHTPIDPKAVDGQTVLEYNRARIHGWCHFFLLRLMASQPIFLKFHVTFLPFAVAYIERE
jgi:hypothetical protein